MGRVIPPRRVDDKRRRADDPGMADGGLTLQIDEALAERLKARAEAAGQSVEDFARQALDAVTQRSPEAEEMDRICAETLRDGGVPWEEFEARLLSTRRSPAG